MPVELVNSYSMGVSRVRYSVENPSSLPKKPGTTREIDGKDVWFPPDPPPKMVPNPSTWEMPPMKPQLSAPRPMGAITHEAEPVRAPPPVEEEKVAAPVVESPAQPAAGDASGGADSQSDADAEAAAEAKRVALAKMNTEREAEAQKAASAKQAAEAKQAEERKQADAKRQAEAKKAEESKKAAAAEAAAAAAAKPKRPDMNGTWLNTEIEGDIEKFFKDGVGLPWAMRKMMSGMKFGINKLTHTMSYDADFTVQTMVNSMMPDAESKNTIDPSKAEAKEREGPPDHKGNKSQYKCYWDNDAIVTEDPSGAGFDMKRYLKGGKMHLELYFPKKPAVKPCKRIFTKQ